MKEKEENLTEFITGSRYTVVVRSPKHKKVGFPKKADKKVIKRSGVVFRGAKAPEDAPRIVPGQRSGDTGG